MWLSVKDYAELSKISRQAVLKGIAKGKYQTREVAGRGKGGVAYEIRMDNIDKIDSMDVATDNLSTDNHVTDNLALTTTDNQSVTIRDKKTTPPVTTGRKGTGTQKGLTSLSQATVPAVPVARMVKQVPQVADNKQVKALAVTEKAETEAALKALLCDDIIKLESNEKMSRKQAIKETLAMYNEGMTHTKLYSLYGSLAERTVYTWLTKYQGKDHLALATFYNRERGHTVPEDDLNFITGYMMSSSNRKVMSGIKLLHYWNRKHGKQQLVSDRTICRAFEAWKQCHSAIYTLNKYGEKYTREKLLPTMELDWSLVMPGELWFSDGHVLNFPVINPWTGKAERPTLITMFDAASRMPVGFDIDMTENKRVIMSAFRNALIWTGYCPKYVKFDNGKGFRAKDVTGKKLSKAEQDDLDEKERILEQMISGAVYRCGVEKASFGIAYNAMSKAMLERWHGTLDMGIERLMPEYMGNCIPNKPARMSRNEKFLKRIESGQALTLLEAKILINEWIMEIYGVEIHSGINGKPLEVYQEHLKLIPIEQKRSADEAYWLMLSTEIKKLDHNGVKVRGIKYWDEAMIDWVGKPVVVRYDQMDDRYVFIFSEDGRSICRALAKELTDPLATMREGGELKAMQITANMKQNRGVMKRLRKATEEHKQMIFKDDNLMQEMIQGGHKLTLTKKYEELPELPPEATEEETRPEQNQRTDEEALDELYKRIGIN